MDGCEEIVNFRGYGPKSYIGFAEKRTMVSLVKDKCESAQCTSTCLRKTAFCAE